MERMSMALSRWFGILLFGIFALSIYSCGGGKSSSTAPAPAPTPTAPSAPVITVQPSNQSAVAGQTAIFSVSATGTAPLGYQWQQNAKNIAGANSTTYTTAPVTAADNGSQFTVLVSNSAGSVTSSAATLTVTGSTASALDVTTYHNDLARTGQNLSETILTTANVNASSFGKVGFHAVDGKVDAEPLYLSAVSIGGKGQHNMLFAVTEHDSVYAFDADDGTILWRVSVLGTGETTSDDHGCNQISPEIGITSTPVIDRSHGPNGAIYVVGMSKDSAGNYHQRLHALDLTTGAELFGGPREIQASYPGTGENSAGGNVIFAPGQYAERAGLLLMNGVIYTTYTSHCDKRPYTGWIIAYDAGTLAQTSVLNLTPNGSEGSIWMSGTAPAADIQGNIYFLDANGTFDTTLDANGFPGRGDFGNSFMKVSTSGKLAPADYFAVHNTIQESAVDEDLGSGGAIVLPDQTDSSGQVHHLAIGAGKDSNIYVVNRDSMGKFDPNKNNIYQEIDGAFPASVFSMPAYFKGTIYYGGVGDHLKSFTIANALLPTTPSQKTSTSFGYPGTTPSISANGTSNAILWAVENASVAVLHAYDANNLATELYNSNASGTRDNFGAGNKFITPMIANGKVFVGTPNGVAVFGLLH
jgi:hypothetical protein